MHLEKLGPIVVIHMEIQSETMGHSGNFSDGYNAWDLFYFRAKPIIYKLWSKKTPNSADHIERAFLKLSVENPEVSPAHYDTLMTRLIDILELNKSVSLEHQTTEQLVDTYYNPN